MTTAGLKSNIHQAVEKIKDPHFLEAVYTILSKKLVGYDYELSKPQEVEIEKRIATYKKGEGKSYSWAEAKKIIKSRLAK